MCPLDDRAQCALYRGQQGGVSSEEPLRLFVNFPLLSIGRCQTARYRATHYVNYLTELLCFSIVLAAVTATGTRRIPYRPFLQKHLDGAADRAQFAAERKPRPRGGEDSSRS